MQASGLIAVIEDEIARLDQARALLTGGGPAAIHRRVLAREVYGGPALRKRRTISAGRARIAAAQKARWAKVKSAAKRAATATPSSAANRPKHVKPRRKPPLQNRPVKRGQRSAEPRLGRQHRLARCRRPNPPDTDSRSLIALIGDHSARILSKDAF